MNRALKFIVGILVFVLVVAAGIGFVGFQFLNSPPSDSDETVVFEVRPGESFKTIARRLEQEGLVTSSSKLQLYAKLSQMTSKIRVGEYSIRRNMNPREVLGVVTSGHSIEYVVTVQEGLNRFEIADIVAKQGVATQKEFLDLTRDPALIKELLGESLPSLEGYLFPETYHVTKFTGARGLVKMMVERFKAKYAELTADPAWNAKKMSRAELVTLASIIEKETGAPEERAVISSVFHNRLTKSMRLQTDPTVIYGVWEATGQWNRNISRDDLMRPSRYNTYTFSGLPYGPIANPGFDAIRAAGAPAKTEFLFFVSRNDGTHVFSRDYEQHQRAVGQFQLDKKAREGKSWRDLKKRDHVPDKVLEAGAPRKPVAGAQPSAKAAVPPAPSKPSKSTQP